MSDGELKARVAMQSFFVLWPDDESGKKKKTSSLAVKLNRCLMMPLVGRAEVCPKLLHVDELVPVLLQLQEEWKVAWL